jgi:hypothetical protein
MQYSICGSELQLRRLPSLELWALAPVRRLTFQQASG